MASYESKRLVTIKVTFPCGPGRQAVFRSTLDDEVYTAAALGSLWEVTGQHRHVCQLLPSHGILSDQSGRSSWTPPSSTAFPITSAPISLSQDLIAMAHTKCLCLLRARMNCAHHHHIAVDGVCPSAVPHVCLGSTLPLSSNPAPAPVVFMQMLS